MKLANRIAKDWFTESDGESFDPMPMLAVVATIFVMVVMGHSYFVKGEEFKVTDFGIGVGAIWAAATGGSRLRPQAYSSRYRSQSEDGPVAKTTD